MRNTQKRFPCMEQPARCFVCPCSPDDRLPEKQQRLCIRRDGQVILSPQRREREEFFLLPTAVESIVLLKNHKFGTYLSRERTEAGNVVVTSTKEQEDNSDNQRWRIVQWSGENDKFFIETVDENDCMKLVCNDEGEPILVPAAMSVISGVSSFAWTFEFVSGELCFVSSPALDKRLRCDMFGLLTLTPNWKGWEVWRFIETGKDGYVRISSWMHKNQYLCSDSVGKVYSVSNAKQEEGTKWAVEKSSCDDIKGVVIRSASTNRLLCFSTPNGSESLILTTVQERTTDGRDQPSFAVWQLEAAHSQKYFLSCMSSDMTLGPFPYVTANKRQTDEWILEGQSSDDGDGNIVVTLFSTSEQKYLGSSSDGQVYYIDDDDNNNELRAELWYMQMKNDGTSYVFTSVEHNRILSYSECHEDDSGQLCTLSADQNDRHSNGKELWRLDPCMPRAVSSGKIRTFAVGTSVAIATTIAMPFAVAGVVGLMGAEVGVLGSVVAAGLTGAEAIASIGVVGTTAALVFKASKDSLSAAAKEVTEEGSNSHSKRPFCEWRSW